MSLVTIFWYCFCCIKASAGLDSANGVHLWRRIFFPRWTDAYFFPDEPTHPPIHAHKKTKIAKPHTILPVEQADSLRCYSVSWASSRPRLLYELMARAIILHPDCDNDRVAVYERCSLCLALILITPMNKCINIARFTPTRLVSRAPRWISRGSDKDRGRKYDDENEREPWTEQKIM